MLIFRVEHKQHGDGPYRGGSFIANGHCDHEIHPAPHNEVPYDYKPQPPPYRNNNRFGFSALKNLKRWFNATECNRLAAEGYHIRVFKCAKPLWVGPRTGQTIFNIQEVKLMHEMGLRDVHKSKARPKRKASSTPTQRQDEEQQAQSV